MSSVKLIDDRGEWTGPTVGTDDLYTNFFKSKFIDGDLKRQIDLAMKRLSKEGIRALKNYCREEII